MTPAALVHSSALRRVGGRWLYRAARPEPDSQAYGYTPKTIRILHGERIYTVVVHKQRWLLADGTTIHDRPAQDISWSSYGLLLVFKAIWIWMNGPRGLHRTGWPWRNDSPSRRSVQRWLRRLLPDAMAWQAAIRAAVVDAIVPRLMEEQFPAGLPPPGGLQRFQGTRPQVTKLFRGLSLLSHEETPPHLTPTALLSEARRRLMASKIC